ncbi:MAG: hypothetical protein QM817_16215 [Archangium sp.]
MFFALMLAASLQQTPLVDRLAITPNPRLAQIEAELEIAPRGWPSSSVTAMTMSLVGMTVFASVTTVLWLTFPFGTPLVLTYVLVGAMVSTGASLISAVIAAIDGGTRAAARRDHVLALQVERERLR